MHAIPAIRGALTGVLIVLLAAACSPEPVPVTDVQPAPAALTDANVAAIVSTVNDGAIEVARLATTKAQNSQVRDFARRLLQEHQTAGEDFRRLLANEGIQPQPVTLTRDLTTNNRQTLDRLRNYEGADFDRAFINHEVETHRWLIRTLEATLIPTTRDRQVRATLEELHGHMLSHLEEAQRLQRTF